MADYVLIAENESKAKINIAKSEKENLFKHAKANAKKELISYEDQLRDETNEKITELNLNRDAFDKIEEDTAKQIKAIEEDYERNKEQVVDILFKKVIEVNITVPEVIKGNFEENF